MKMIVTLLQQENKITLHQTFNVSNLWRMKLLTLKGGTGRIFVFKILATSKMYLKLC